MNATELALWLVDHGHRDVEIKSEDRVTSSYAGKPRAFERVALAYSTDLFGDLEQSDYWKRVKS